MFRDNTPLTLKIFVITTVSIYWLVTKKVYFKHFLDIDECSAKTHGCDANAVCHNTEGSFICKCKAGYVRNGQNCVGKLLLVGYQSAGSV